MLSKTKNHSCVELCIQSNEQDDFETRPSSNGIISKSLEDKEITITTFLNNGRAFNNAITNSIIITHFGKKALYRSFCIG